MMEEKTETPGTMDAKKLSQIHDNFGAKKPPTLTNRRVIWDCIGVGKSNVLNMNNRLFANGMNFEPSTMFISRWDITTDSPDLSMPVAMKRLFRSATAKLIVDSSTVASESVVHLSASSRDALVAVNSLSEFGVEISIGDVDAITSVMKMRKKDPLKIWVNLECWDISYPESR